MAADATVAEQEYLESMFWIDEAGLPMTGANIARAMQLSAPTVHEMVGRLVKDGYVDRNADKSLKFTEEGREKASYIVRRHRMIERFLTDVLKIPWDEVHEEAERIEHAMSPVLEERMRAAIGDATTCPHGHPIVEGIRERGSLLADVEIGADVVVLRFENEAEELLHYLMDAGLHPGLAGKVSESDSDHVTIKADDGDHVVTYSVAETVSVRADPAPPHAPRSPSSSCSRATVTGAERLRRGAQVSIGTATKGSVVGFFDPPAGSRVTRTVVTPFMSSIVVEAWPAWSGAKRAGTGSTMPSAFHPCLEDAALRQLLDAGQVQLAAVVFGDHFGADPVRGRVGTSRCVGAARAAVGADRVADPAGDHEDRDGETREGLPGQPAEVQSAQPIAEALP